MILKFCNLKIKKGDCLSFASLIKFSFVFIYNLFLEKTFIFLNIRKKVPKVIYSL